jgi:hypothetical protein
MMRYRSMLISALIVSSGGACSSCADPSLSIRPPGIVKLKVGSSASIDGTPWTVIFDSVVSDSRCPIGVFCIQEGEAVLALELASPLADPLPHDSPHLTLGMTSVTVEGLRFTQVELSPLMMQNVKIDPQSYVVTLKIEDLITPD